MILLRGGKFYLFSYKQFDLGFFFFFVCLKGSVKCDKFKDFTKKEMGQKPSEVYSNVHTISYIFLFKKMLDFILDLYCFQIIFNKLIISGFKINK